MSYDPRTARRSSKVPNRIYLIDVLNFENFSCRTITVEQQLSGQLANGRLPLEVQSLSLEILSGEKSACRWTITATAGSRSCRLALADCDDPTATTKPIEFGDLQSGLAGRVQTLSNGQSN